MNEKNVIYQSMKELLNEFLVAMALGLAIGSTVGGIFSIFKKGQFWNITMTAVGLVLMYSVISTIVINLIKLKKGELKKPGLLVFEIIPLALGLAALWLWPITNWLLQ